MLDINLPWFVFLCSRISTLRACCEFVGDWSTGVHWGEGEAGMVSPKAANLAIRLLRIYKWKNNFKVQFVQNILSCVTFF